MINCIKSERLKYKRTSIKKMLWLIPFAAAFIGITLSGPMYGQYLMYNMWYTLFLPFLIGLISSALVSKEKNHLYHGLLSIFEDKKQLWIAKIIYGVILVLIGECVTAFIGSIFYINAGGFGIRISQNLIAIVVLTICYAWQLPLFMYITRKINFIVSTFLCVIMNMFFQIFFSMKIWWIPFAIPARLMCPVLGMYPNGVMITDPLDPYINTDKILPGILICIGMFIVTSILTTKSFEREQV